MGARVLISATWYYNYFLSSATTAAPLLALEIVSNPVESASDIERSVKSFGHVPNGALLILPDSTNIAHRDLLITAVSPAIHNS
jgi:hypothetical protein